MATMKKGDKRWNGSMKMETSNMGKGKSMKMPKAQKGCGCGGSKKMK